MNTLCRHCGNKETVKIAKLGNHAVTNKLTRSLDSSEKLFPLTRPIFQMRDGSPRAQRRTGDRSAHPEETRPPKVRHGDGAERV